jgi:HD superfamily phosphohydrolase
MPNWGLSEAQRRTKPWGIGEEWLTPWKTVTDPVHGDIYLNRLEAAVADSAPMQRLRGVRQLGTSHLIYPGATHSRFSHALGTLRAAQDLLDAVVAGLSGPRPTEGHLLKEWEAEGLLDATTEDSPTVFDFKIAEATVLARLGGLLHDLCHVPMGHTVEDDLKILVPHDGNVARFEKLWNQIGSDVRNVIGDELSAQVRPLIMSKVAGDQVEVKYPFVTDIVGNTICADLMDYLRRDHYATGLPIALGDRFVNEFYVTPGDEPLRSGRMAVHIDRNGHLRHDVVTELVKYLRYRYELSERVLYHHAKVGADAMIGKLLDMWRDALWATAAFRDHEHLFANPAVLSNATMVRDTVRVGAGAEACDELDRLVADRVEDQFLNWDDDGLLKDLQRTTTEEATSGGPGSSRLTGVSSLCDMVLHRQLFKSLGRADSDADQADAEMIHQRWGSPEARRDLEEGAAHFAGIKPRWKLVLWVPGPKMRPKPAEVLVERLGRVAALADMPPAVSGDAKAIVDQHARLWGVAAYVHPDITSTLQKRAALAWLRDATGLSFLGDDGTPVMGVGDLLAETVMQTAAVETQQLPRLKVLATGSSRGNSGSFSDALRSLDALRVAQGLGRPERITSEELASLGWPSD